VVQHADIDHTGVTGAGAAAHIADTDDAHDASAISFSPTGTIAATDVQAAIAEVASEAGSGGALDYIRLEDQKAQNTAGGTFTSGAWQTRVLQTEVTDTGGHCTLASNQFTLAAGTYEIFAACPAAFVDGHVARLQNVTAGTTLIAGQNSYSSANETDITMTPAIVRGVFTIGASKALEIQHRCQVTRANNGFGAEMNWGTEVFTVVELWKRA
jgi:prepilin-type processing-associated H-X9-DG protein